MPLLPPISCSGNECIAAFELAFIPAHSQASLSSQGLKGAGAAVCFRRGTASNFRGLWLRSSVRCVFCSRTESQRVPLGMAGP